MNNKLVSLIMVGAATLFASTANAEKMLNADQVKKLVTGKTITAKHLIKGFGFTVYFDKDNKTAFRKQKGITKQTTYSLKGDKHCMLWNGKQHCAQIRANKDGTWSRINPQGKAVVTWSKFVDGKKL